MRFLDFDLRPEKMTLKAQIFPDFLTSEGDQFPTFGGIFSDLRWKSKNRIGNAYSIVLRSRKIPHMTKSVHWFGCRLWCYRFKSLHILYFGLFCTQFLDAPTHLYMKLFPSDSSSVGRSVRLCNSIFLPSLFVLNLF